MNYLPPNWRLRASSPFPGGDVGRRQQPAGARGRAAAGAGHPHHATRPKPSCPAAARGPRQPALEAALPPAPARTVVLGRRRAHRTERKRVREGGREGE